MILSELSISRLINGNINDLPLKLQILDIHRLQGDVCGKFIARIKLSDGINYYRGFVIDVSNLELLHVNVYAVVSIDRLVALKHSEGKYVLQIIEMHLISQENHCLGIPEACSYMTINTSHSAINKNLSQHTASSCVLEQQNIVPQVIPILQLSISASKETSIEGQVIRKSGICKFSNGTGKFFTFDIADLHSTIRCKGFNQVVDLFFEVIVVGQAYHVVNFVLSRANKQYNNLSHDLEINLTKDSIICSIDIDPYQNVHSKCNLIKIYNVSLNDVGKFVDLLVTIKTITDADLIYLYKKNAYLHKRIITVYDDSGNANIVLWGDFAKTFSGKLNQNILFEDLLVKSFKGELQFATTMVTSVKLQ
ncbi:unnamed protein product [Adineta steineri]|uniref:Replication protein A OB domain-containing protein n=1 Tax=Adineta steineri TaxID=433720 RepID=A0A815DDY7_9BILA|nr:unnamed protein product [Adineta steineri]CAF1476106.1 unnamed protein product [Adineta steineri]CAF3810652.1 unnamed protein product [Adineta steineri]CAF4021590.1 unnamed protein product [Adineta steineri]